MRSHGAWAVLVLSLSTALVACGSESSGSGTSTTSTTSTSSSAATGSGGSGAGGDSGETVAESSSSGSGGAGGCEIAADCDDQDVCTDDACSAGVCNHFEVDIDDDDACTIDACDPGTGPSNTPVEVDDGDACTADACDPVSGEVTHGEGGCDDGDLCTVDACDAEAGCSNTVGACSATFAGVQPIFQAKCTPCHAGGSPDGCAGGTCFASSYEGSQVTMVGGNCDGQPAFDCVLQTILDGSMPQGGGCTGDPAADAGLSECIQTSELAAIEQWIGAGAPP